MRVSSPLDWPESCSEPDNIVEILHAHKRYMFSLGHFAHTCESRGSVAPHVSLLSDLDAPMSTVDLWSSEYMRNTCDKDQFLTEIFYDGLQV
jgi:hypothetical protein